MSSLGFALHKVINEYLPQVCSGLLSCRDVSSREIAVLSEGTQQKIVKIQKIT